MTGTRARSQASLTRAFAKAAYDIYCNVLEDELKTLYEEVEKDFSCTTKHANNDRTKNSNLLRACRGGGDGPAYLAAAGDCGYRGTISHQPLGEEVLATGSLGFPDF